jgi:S1-C subfamily serine protease
VIRVRNTGCGELGVGSAWLASDGTVVTNHHVVADRHELEMLTWDGIDLAPSEVDVANDLDIARLSGDWSSAPELVPLPVRQSRVEPGERIAIVGFPEGERLAVTSGVAVGYGPEPDTPEHEVLKLTTVIKPGNSGGPAIDVHGEVVGVAFAKERDNDEALVIPIQDVMALGPGAFSTEQPCR